MPVSSVKAVSQGALGVERAPPSVVCYSGRGIIGMAV